MVFSSFFNLSLNLAIRSSLSEPQSAPSLVFADCIELLHLFQPVLVLSGTIMNAMIVVVQLLPQIWAKATDMHF